MRPIDADKLIEKLRDFKEYENDDGRPIHTMSEIQRIDRCINFAQAESTAYDVDKVVEHLETARDGYSTAQLMTATNDELVKRFIAKEKAMNLSIEIVKAGGIDGD
nr:MAG TPA: Urease subunit gamma 2 [Caudoviricetes sp.]